MGSYTQFITNDGEALIAQSLSGGTLTFTEVVTSSAAVSKTDEEIRTLTQLADICQTVTPSAATKIGDETIQVSSTFTNKEVTQGYAVQTVGLYARINSDAPKLFAVARAEKASDMPVYSDTSAVSLVFNFNMAVSQADQIMISIMSGGALPSEVFYQIFSGLAAPTEANAKNFIQVTSQGTWEYITMDSKPASLTDYGFVKLSNSSAVTDSTGLALPATEKNASIEGTLANQISVLNTDKVNASANRYTFLNKSLNSVNIDEVFNYNYVTAISTDGFGTMPEDIGWCSVANFYSDHFVFQIAVSCRIHISPGDSVVRMWIRERHAERDYYWSAWVLVV